VSPESELTGFTLEKALQVFTQPKCSTRKSPTFKWVTFSPRVFSDISFRAVVSWQAESKGEDEIDRALLAGFDQQILGLFRGRDGGWKERRSVERMNGTWDDIK